MLKRLLLVLALAVVAAAGSGCIVIENPPKYHRHR